MTKENALSKMQNKEIKFLSESSVIYHMTKHSIMKKPCDFLQQANFFIQGCISEELNTNEMELKETKIGIKPNQFQGHIFIFSKKKTIGVILFIP